MRIHVALASGVLLGVSSPAAAQETTAVARAPAAECVCVLPGDTASGLAAVEDIRGQVLLADDVGYSRIQSKADLAAGDRVVLLGDGQAVLVAGTTCRVALAPLSIISLIRTDFGICVAQSQVMPIQAQADGSPTPGLAASGGLLVSGGLIAAGTMGAVSIAADADDPVSP